MAPKKGKVKTPAHSSSLAASTSNASSPPGLPRPELASNAKRARKERSVTPAEAHPAGILTQLGAISRAPVSMQLSDHGKQTGTPSTQVPSQSLGTETTTELPLAEFSEVSSSSAVTIDVTGYWTFFDRGVKWSYLFFQVPDHMAPNRIPGTKPFVGKIVGPVSFFCGGTVTSNTSMRWAITWPENEKSKGLMYAARISDDGQSLGLTSCKIEQEDVKHTDENEMRVTRVPDDQLSVQQSAVLLAMRERQAHVPHAVVEPPLREVAPAIAYPFVRSLGFTFVFLPESPLILVWEVLSGSWAHGVGMTPGDEILTINGQSAAQIWPRARFMQLVKCRPVTFTFRKSRAVHEAYPGSPDLYSMPKSKTEAQSVAADSATSTATANKEDAAKKDQGQEMWDTFNQKRLELWMFEGTWQLSQKCEERVSKVGEVQMGWDGNGIVTENGRKAEYRFCIEGRGTSESPYIANGWALVSWRRTKRIWRALKGTQEVTWTLMSRPPNSVVDNHAKVVFRREIEKDCQEDRDRALQISAAAPDSDLSNPALEVSKGQGLPLHLFSRQEGMAWRWEGINKPLRKDLVDADSWNDEIGH